MKRLKKTDLYPFSKITDDVVEAGLVQVPPFHAGTKNSVWIPSDSHFRFLMSDFRDKKHVSMA